LAIHRLNLISVRNHKETEFNFSPGVTVIWGENGSGKTAVLEAVNTLSFGRSFKTHRQRELINTEKKELFIRGVFFARNQEDHVAAKISKISGQVIKLNGKTVHNRKDLLGRNIVVVLSPEEQGITKGPPMERRKFFDRIFSVVSPEYLKTLQGYSRTLKQRNAALIQLRENKITNDDLETWTKPLALYGTRLWDLRYKFMTDFKGLHAKVSKQYDRDIKTEIIYEHPGNNQEKYLEKLEKTIKRDLVLGRTEHGPHRDDVLVKWSGRNIKTFGSQGEHKLCLILLKLAELFFIKEKTGELPTLLLDDLFDKLDLERCKSIVRLLQEFETISGHLVQTIVTTTDLINVEQSGLMSATHDHRTYHLER
jgi:DNA replication and repair protein RecF